MNLRLEPSSSRWLICVDYSEFPVSEVPSHTLDKANVTFHQNAWEEIRFWQKSLFPAYGYNNEVEF